ncbi:MAG: BTAD domain-containing putative transcriptional regulator [Chloroflexota bacterium]
MLAYLAVNGRSSRDTLATLLWPEHNQQGARNNLRRTLFKLNKTAVSQWLCAENESLELAANGCIDLHQFQAHLEANERQQAVDLYHGDFLADFFLPNNSEFEAWSHSQRERLRQQVFGLLDSLIQDGLDRGDYKTAEKQARRQLEIDDLHEPAHQQLMLALAKQGQRRAALAVYERCQTHFDTELGIAPSRQTALLFQQIEAEKIQPAIQQQLAVKEGGGVTAVSTSIKRHPALAILLAKVKSFWIEGMLEHAVAGEALLPLAKETVPEGIANPWQTVVQPDFTRQVIEAEEPIETLFAASGHALLILGAPGAGKTTTLLDLARITIAQAEDDPKRPIPVVFNLAS